MWKILEGLFEADEDGAVEKEVGGYSQVEETS